ncbi:hypothetical protein HQO26_11250 [Rhodococcus fascians]|nr:hypothetical protein [Rhodococcus fascians]MBY4415191.1 hypothetical protein [Rhodococcus fascians]
MTAMTLLFDSACGVCSATAAAAERESQGQLQVRSLREPGVRTLLDEHAKGWSWKPMLLVGSQDAPSVLTGAAMTRRLLSVLGVRSTWAVMRSMTSAASAPVSGMSRRAALRAAGGTVLAVGAIAVGAPAVGAQPAAEEPIDGADLDRLVERTTGSEAGAHAVAAILAAGYTTDGASPVAYNTDSGETVVMVFYPSSTNPATEAAALIQSTRASGEARTRVEFVNADLAAEERDRAQPLSSLQAQLGPVFNPPGVETLEDAGAYISCVAFCVGGSCGGLAARCRLIPFLAAALACMVGVCGSKARVCHNSCRGLW